MTNEFEVLPQSAWPDLKPFGRGKGNPVSTITNLMYLLDYLNISVRYNVITKDLEIHDPDSVYGSFDNGKNSAIDAIVSQCNRFGLPSNNTQGFLEAIGYKNKYNPVAEWITSRTYDGKSDYIGQMCNTVRARPNFDPRFKDILIKKWLVSCVAMAFNDDANYWSKGVLTFQGHQDLGKTSWFWKLFPSGCESWGKEGLALNPSNKDSVAVAIRHWIVELGELDATFKKSDIARIKAFLTNRKDVLRLPYARKESTYPRRTSFFASVNPTEFLQDETGNIRFWVIPVAKIDYKHNIDIQQVWAQAYDLYCDGHEWFLPFEESQQLEKYNEDCRELSPIEEKIIAYSIWANDEMTATEVLSAIGYHTPTKADRNAAAKALRKHFGESDNTGSRRVFKMY